MSRRRREVAEALAAADGFTSAQDVHVAMRAGGSTIGLATVYRALQAMVEDDEADVVLSATGEARYRRCTPNHHHHLVCRECGRAEEVHAPSVERWAADVARRHGFTDPDHVVEVTGVCADCAAR